MTEAVSVQNPLLLLEMLLRFGKSPDGAVESDLRRAMEAQAARVKELERERDLMLRGVEPAIIQWHDRWRNRALAAEAEAAKLRAEVRNMTALREVAQNVLVEVSFTRDRLRATLAEAVEVVRPFVFGDAALEQILWGDMPDDKKGTVTVSLRDLRRIRAFHTKHSGEKP